jgi:epoxyqueuosine reductase QueG
MICRHFGSGVRLAGVTTDMALVGNSLDHFGADEFCATCQICARDCPPAAIVEHKQMVRGEERWYVNFEKCIPYFTEASGCGICIAVCPWTRRDVRPKLLASMGRRLGLGSAEVDTVRSAEGRQLENYVLCSRSSVAPPWPAPRWRVGLVWWLCVWCCVKARREPL